MVRFVDAFGMVRNTSIATTSARVIREPLPRVPVRPRRPR
jgi:hypothetical protein